MGNELGTQAKSTNKSYKQRSNYSDSSDSDDYGYGYSSARTYTPSYEHAAPAPQYAPGEEPWRSKIQKPYDTKKDKQRLGRLVGGSLTVTEEEKKRLDAQKRQQRKK